MPSKRTPRRLEANRVITPAAVAAFERLQRASSSDEWWAAHEVLHDTLHGRTWEWPIVQDPRAQNPFPAGCHAAEQWERERVEKPEPVLLWQELEQASKAARRSRRAPRNPSS
jgi:hypothetical protein